MTIGSETFLQDSTLFLRSIIASGVTDPISSSRDSKSKFVLTSYPETITEYPQISIMNMDIKSRPLGMSSSRKRINIPFEIRVWARNYSEKDKITQELVNALQYYQFDDTYGTINNEMYSFDITSAQNVDEAGKGGVKSKIIQVNYDIIT